MRQEDETILDRPINRLKLKLGILLTSVLLFLTIVDYPVAQIRFVTPFVQVPRGAALAIQRSLNISASVGYPIPCSIVGNDIPNAEGSSYSGDPFSEANHAADPSLVVCYWGY